MECNRDEAVRAKEIAEKKFYGKDIVGAKKFATKAQNLYPGLEGIQQMLATLDVYIFAENKINGETDWYGILGVSPESDEETVRKQYRKLALLLHPDKNKSVGAEGAFKFISEAWSLLSDKAKRLVYDQKRNIKVFKQKVQKQSGGSSASPGGNGFYNFTKGTSSSHTRVQKNNATKTDSSSVPASSHKQKAASFWTVCHRCKMQYEYLRVYLNHNLLCPNCREPFFAIETGAPTTNGSNAHSQSNNSQQRQNSNQGMNKNVSSQRRNKSSSTNVGRHSPDTSNQTNSQWGPFSKTAGASDVAHAATLVQQAYEKVKREREEAQAATKRDEALRRKNHTSKKMSRASSSGYPSITKRRKGMEDVGASYYGNDGKNKMGMGAGGMTNIHGLNHVQSEHYGLTGTSKPSSAKDVSQFENQIMLMAKARAEIRKRLKECNSTSMSKSAVTGDVNLNVNGTNKEYEKSNVMVSDDPKYQNNYGDSTDTKNFVYGDERKIGLSSDNEDKELLEPMTINVPDSDFHDFDKDRLERCFGENQVWAAYDDDDGMPRYYALIHNMISLNPFKMRISWLNSKTNSELGSLNWVGSGFSKSCGDFRIGKHQIYSSLNSFSHKVRWIKGTGGVIRIFPRKGDVWALYRNWSPDWNELTADEVIHKYDMVEVLDDYDEELGVTVLPLVKVAGFKTVFHWHMDPNQVWRIPREELFRFSHHVPRYLLTGQEAPNAPKGCHELDPAATPMELFQVISDVKEEMIVQNEEEAEKFETFKCVGETNVEDMGVISNKNREEISRHSLESNEITVN